MEKNWHCEAGFTHANFLTIPMETQTKSRLNAMTQMLFKNL